MNCKHCGAEIHIMHPLHMQDGRMVWSWSHDAGPSGCIADGKFTGTQAEPEEEEKMTDWERLGWLERMMIAGEATEEELAEYRAAVARLEE